MENELEMLLNEKDDFVHGIGAKTEDILDAEKKLNISFAKDYLKYLSKYGQISYDGHELTGIGFVERLNVVSMTLEKRKYNQSIKGYVLEKVGLDSIVIWQDEKGRIYQTTQKNDSKIIANSLLEYIQKF